MVRTQPPDTVLPLQSAETEPGRAVEFHLGDVRPADVEPFVAAGGAGGRERLYPADFGRSARGLLVDPAQGARERQAGIRSKPQPGPFRYANARVPAPRGAIRPHDRVLRAVVDELEHVDPGVEDEPRVRNGGRLLTSSDFRAVGDLPREARGLIVRDPRLHARACHVERHRTGVARSSERVASHNAALERPLVELGFGDGERRRRAGLDHDRALREITVSHRRDAADDLHTVDDGGWNPP